MRKYLYGSLQKVIKEVTMKPKILFFLILIATIILFSGCIESPPKCEKPYILVGNECCLDENNNGICDEKETTTLEETTTLQKYCTDSDGGKNSHVKVSVSYVISERWKGNFTDHCWKKEAVVEYWCSEKNPKKAIIDCPPDYKCINGACEYMVTTTSTTTTSTTTTTISPSTTVRITTTTTLPSKIPTKLAYKPREPPSGATVVEVDSERYKAEFKRYKLKIEYQGFIYSSEYEVSRILLDIQKPDGTLVQSELGWDPCENDFYDGKVDDIVMRLWSVEEYVGKLKAKIYMWSYQEHPVMKEKPQRGPPNPKAEHLHLTSEGYTGEYKNYLFKIDRLFYSKPYHVNGMRLNVKKPNGAVEKVEIYKGEKGKVDDLKIFAYFCGQIRENRAVALGDIYVWES